MDTIISIIYTLVNVVLNEKHTEMCEVRRSNFFNVNLRATDWFKVDNGLKSTTVTWRKPILLTNV